MQKSFTLTLFVTTLLMSEVNILEELPYIDVIVDNKTIRIQRIQDTSNKLNNDYTKTSRPAPPFSIQPYEQIKGIETVSEIDVMHLLKKQQNNHHSLLIDSRLNSWYEEGTIPGAINVPFTDYSTKKHIDIFNILGVSVNQSKFDFSQAKDIMLFDNGPWCQQAREALIYLVDIGYPKEKITYYRGGMQYWQILGLTILSKNNAHKGN